MNIITVISVTLLALPACGGVVDPAPAPTADAAVPETAVELPSSCVIEGVALQCTGNNWVMIIPEDAGFGDIDAGINCAQTRCEPGWTCVDRSGASGICE